MTTQRLTLTDDERRALLMLSYGANGAATAMCNGSSALGAVSNAITSLVQGDINGALLALRCLAMEAREDAPPPAIGARYRDGSGDVWTVREAGATWVSMMHDESRSWSLGTGTFAVQVRMGYLTAVTP
jgi:hypothetical protein